MFALWCGHWHRLRLFCITGKFLRSWSVTDYGCLRRRVTKTLCELSLTFFSKRSLMEHLVILFKVSVNWIACISWHICELLDYKLWPAAFFIPSSSSGPGIFSVKMSNLNQEEIWKCLLQLSKRNSCWDQFWVWLITNCLQKEANIIHNLGKAPGRFARAIECHKLWFKFLFAWLLSFSSLPYLG